jgi:2-methylcitrate dehydratase PrpD
VTGEGTLVPALVARADEVVAGAGAEVRARTGTHLLDALGCLVVGAGHPSARLLRRFADLTGEAGTVPVLGDAGPRSLRMAVLLESAYLHLDEFDAIHSAGAVVPPAGVVPAALAVAARCGSSGRDLVDAVLGGYDVVVEAGLRLGGPALYPERWWPTAALGALGAAWASARLLGLDEEGRRRAVVLAAHAAGGPIGSDALGEGHYLEGGRAASCGVEAAYQAAAGLRGDPGLLDAGLPGSSGRPLGPPSPGTAPHLLACSFKRYPFARPLHAALAALDQLAAEGVSVASARRVEVHVPAPLRRFVTAARAPRGPVEAASSAWVAVAAHLAGRADDVTFIRTATAPEAPPVELVAAEDLVADLPARWSGRVVVHLADGGTAERRVGDAPSPSEDEIVGKYRRNVRAAPPGPAAELLASCRALDALPAAARLRETLHRTVATAAVG